MTHRGEHPATDAAAVPPERAIDAEETIARITRRAADRDDVLGLLLVGSYARDAARPDSDIDLVLLTTQTARYTDGAWADELNLGEPTRTRSWGPIVERRFVTGTGLEVEINIGSPEWANVDPVDPGTRRVVTDGARILHDPEGILTKLQRACRDACPAGRQLAPQYPSSTLPMTTEEYEALPEEISRAIEIVDGYVVHCEIPAPDHQTAGRRLANLLESHARAAMGRGHGCLTVNNDVDLRLRDVPLLNRRPDVVLYRCLDRDSGERLRAEHVLLVVEIVSPGSETQDTTDKPGEYAKAGIPHYWIVRLDNTGVSVIERYQLDRATMLYKHIATYMKDEGGEPPTVGNPIPITIDWPALEF